MELISSTETQGCEPSNPGHKQLVLDNSKAPLQAQTLVKTGNDDVDESRITNADVKYDSIFNTRPGNVLVHLKPDSGNFYQQKKQTLEAFEWIPEP